MDKNHQEHKILDHLENTFTKNSEQISEDAIELKKLEIRLSKTMKDRDDELLNDEPDFKEVELHESEIKKIKESIESIRRSTEEKMSSGSEPYEQIEG